MKSLLRLRPMAAGLLCASMIGCAADAEPTMQEGSSESSESSAAGHTGHGATPTLQQEAAPDTTGLECHKLLAHNGDLKAEYKVVARKDSYVNFTFKAPWTGMAYGMIFRPIIDNKQAIHHWLLFQTPGTNAVGIAPSVGAHPAGTLLSGWAPGGETVDMRELADGKSVGVELSPSNTYTVEFHYNSADANATDASGVEICVQKEKPADIASLGWLGWDQLGAPAKKWTGTCRPTTQKPIHIMGVVPHMHKTGIHMKGTINRKDGTKEVVHDQPFDFNYQRSYAVDITLNPGDTITTECDYSAPAVFGQPTDQEMCYLFSMAYPKGALAAPDIWGTVAHGASSCLGQ